ncbi:MAG: MmcQ/YjbR family DNA-binding protein [Arenimonas sp.]|nr:MmcQ/YjbR family DNA-binding protein [Arenimonas sp.]MBP7981995.1 MmcQ/YjbR family DNA-binding protein [Arenimonas sp.]
MDVDQVRAYCSQMPGAESRLYGPPSNFLSYMVFGRQFAYFKTSDPEKWRFSFRTATGAFLELTDIPGFKPARYMGRFHWVTVIKVNAVPEAYLKSLIDWSYQKALSGLSKRKQSVIAGA